MRDGVSNEGLGECRLEATAKIAAPISWMEGGKLSSFAATVLAAVHDYNCSAASGEWVALDFPEANYQREFAGSTGSLARLVGSRNGVMSVLSSERMSQFRRRTVQPEDLISDFTPRKEGYCVVRSRSTNKMQSGEIRRRLRRAVRNGRPTEALEKKLKEVQGMTVEERRAAADAPREAFLQLGKIPFKLQRKKVKSEGATAKVSTYGFSSSGNPVIFDKWIEDAPTKHRPEAAHAVAPQPAENWLLAD
jgi:hypothetical protein